MLNATRDLTLPTTVTGSWPRPSWFTEVLRGRPFKEALGDSRFREQYMNAVSCIVKAQELAGLEIVTDGDSRFDLTVGGKSWFFYPIERLLGITGHVDRAAGAGWTTIQPGQILYEVLEAYQPAVAGEKLRGGPLQYAALFKVARRFSVRPVKFGSISAQTMTKMIANKHYGSDHELILDVADIVNAELREAAAAGCRVIQVEEPRHHIAAADGISDGELQFLTDALNREIKGVETEVWLRTCWGIRASSPSTGRGPPTSAPCPTCSRPPRTSSRWNARARVAATCPCSRNTTPTRRSPSAWSTTRRLPWSRRKLWPT
jgi:5-methyltetrahydropteroyltriglutamate--homocysteine methyltransferase